MVRTGFTVFLDARSDIEAVNGREAVERVTEHETEVLVPIARGRSDQEIAEELVLSEQTVKTHIGRSRPS
ncbi:LuxR C-terminal-related transcriptional regulator [Streptosporangium sp. NPDC020145]|uniref:Response regulator transcription factor n=1 Tax=Streptosporangium jomthongense TaxID=1193683 RepID=A0ABV8F423_9ACTN